MWLNLISIKHKMIDKKLVSIVETFSEQHYAYDFASRNDTVYI